MGEPKAKRHGPAGPARGYSWPPFEKGNTLGKPRFVPGHEDSLKHGADSDRWRPIAEALTAELATTAPWTSGPAYAGAVAAWARNEAQIVLIGNYLDRVGLLDDEGLPRPASNRLDRLESRAETLRARLGLDPLSMVKLLGGLSAIAAAGPADDLEALKKDGRIMLKSWERHLELGTGDQEATP